MTEAYLAKPSGPCCLSGTLHEGTPRGTHETISDLDTYITQPPLEKANGNILLYFPDVWGFFNNGFLVMDAFADAGYLVIGVDYFRGDPVWKHRKNREDTTTDPGFDYEAWKRKYIAFADQVVPGWVEGVKERYGKVGTRYACVGYCFGAPYVCNALADGTASAGAFGHPAFLTEKHFYELKKPLFLSCSEVDHTFDTKSRRRAVDVLQEIKVPYQVQLFQGVQHGFALRCNLDDPYERYVKEQSLSGIVQWFDFWLKE